ncbi:hypothetical protein CTEN210_09650 [Chaetoceros tenuissimus]|uniref:MYND-type domain-containing protein n=1 Tax=Chaetoceros tenuissimus TaxID=426638 RepID=A0AAD3CZ03_9STRA|nr:hypothetical protein CTEN210_09650 [Chaetoceros tenuissimus]
MKNPSLLDTRTASGKGLMTMGTEKQANAYIHQMQQMKFPLFSSTLLVSINQYIHNPIESIEDRFKLIEITMQAKDVECTGNGILHGYYFTMGSICANASKDLLREVVTDTELNILFNHFVSLLKYAISRENKGALIDEVCLQSAMLLISSVLKFLSPSHAIIRDFLKSLASAAKQATHILPQDSGVGYFLCQTMMLCFEYVRGNKTTGIDKALMMMYKTGMLEQVLLYIHLPWTPTVLNDFQDNFKNLARLFFITAASCSASLSSMFKAGSPSRDALIDVLEGRIKPCPENEHMMEVLGALKKFLDMGLTSGNPDEKYISMQNIECAKCGMQDSTQKLLVCGNCKFFRYCSRECQVAHWKDHKVRCKEYASHAKTKNKEAIAHKFMLENQPQMLEKLRKIYDGGDLVLDLDFSNQSSPALPPALRNPPEFEVFPADIFWSREKDKAPAGHWFFKDLGGGETFYSDEHIKYIREEVDARAENRRSDYLGVYVFLRFSDKPQIVATSLLRDTMKANYNQSEERKKCESYQQRRQNYILQHSDEIIMGLLVNPYVKDLSASEKEKWVKNQEEEIGELFDLLEDERSKKVIGHTF